MIRLRPRPKLVRPVSRYDPLDYTNLARSCVLQLLAQPVFSLPLDHQFTGSGVYALFYSGDIELYAGYRTTDVSNPTRPIYVGKAEPKGSRKGLASGDADQGTELFDRIREHTKSIDAVNNLNASEFSCRYLVVLPDNHQIGCVKRHRLLRRIRRWHRLNRRELASELGELKVTSDMELGD